VIGKGALKMVESQNQGLNPQDGEQVLRSFQEWMVQHAHAVKSTRTDYKEFSDLDNHASRKGSYFSPSIASPDPSIKSPGSASPELSIDSNPRANIEAVVSNESSVGRRVFRTVVGGFLIAVVVAVVWQAYRDDPTRELIKSRGHSSLIWLSSVLGTMQRGAELAAEPASKLSDQAVTPPTPTSVPTKEFPELQQQLQTMVNDLAVLQRIVEQLASKQEQMSRDMATVQAAEQNVSEKISSLAQAAPVHAPPRKNVPKLVHSETPKQPVAAALPLQTPPAATASPADEPPRPPLPLPTPPAGTPSPLH
jgi:hypothetical protein